MQKTPRDFRYPNYSEPRRISPQYMLNKHAGTDMLLQIHLYRVALYIQVLTVLVRQRELDLGNDPFCVKRYVVLVCIRPL